MLKNVNHNIIIMIKSSNKVYDPFDGYSIALKKIEESGIIPLNKEEFLPNFCFKKAIVIFLQKIYLMKLKKKIEKFQWLPSTIL